MCAAFDALIIYKPKLYCKRSPSFDTAQQMILLFISPVSGSLLRKS